MKRNLSLSLAPRLIIFGILVQLFHPGYVRAGGTVTVCDEGNLRAALAGGGLVTMACDGTIVLTNTLAITNDTTIDATGHGVTLSGGDTVRVFLVTNPAALSLVNLTIAHGRAAGTNGPNAVAGGDARGGGALVDHATLMASECQFISNVSTGGTGGIGVGVAGGAGGSAFGGGVYLNSATLSATNCNFYGNSANGGTGGGVAGLSGLIPGFGGNGSGGAIFSSTGVVTVANCLFQTNQAHGGLAGISFILGTSSSISGAASGGAVQEQGGSMTNISCEFIANAAFTPNPPQFGSIRSLSGRAAQGGALFNDSGVLIEIGGTFTSNNVAGGNADYANSLPGPGQGGAIFNRGDLQVSGSVFKLNQAAGGIRGDLGGSGEGGALYSTGPATMSQTWFSSNSVRGGVGMESTLILRPSGVGEGGAIYNSNSIAVVACTFSDNVADGVVGGFSGGGIFSPTPALGGGIYNVGSASVTNSTLVRNLARGGSPDVSGGGNNGADAFGGGLFTSNGVVISVNNTFALNNAQPGVGTGAGHTNGTSYGGGIFSTNGSTTLLNTLLAAGSFGSNFSGTLTDAGHNLSSDSSCNFSGPGSLNNTDPKLGPLDDYGGPTPTVPLLTGSPAIDGGDTALGPPTDQRGRTRPYGAASDIGAFESSAPFVIRGNVSGYTLAGEVEVVCESTNVTTVKGNYSLEGLAAGDYNVRPSDSDYLFYPTNRLLTVGPDQVGVDFKAYRWNALSRESFSGGTLRLMFAGTNGLTYRVLFSTNITDWIAISTNVPVSSNLFEILDTSVLSRPAGFYRTVQP
jgi:hypothetical protein